MPSNAGKVSRIAPREPDARLHVPPPQKIAAEKICIPRAKPPMSFGAYLAWLCAGGVLLLFAVAAAVSWL